MLHDWLGRGSHSSDLFKDFPLFWTVCGHMVMAKSYIFIWLYYTRNVSLSGWKTDCENRLDSIRSVSHFLVGHPFSEIQVQCCICGFTQGCFCLRKVFLRGPEITHRSKYPLKTPWELFLSSPNGPTFGMWDCWRLWATKWPLCYILFTSTTWSSPPSPKKTSISL